MSRNRFNRQTSNWKLNFSEIRRVIEISVIIFFVASFINTTFVYVSNPRYFALTK